MAIAAAGLLAAGIAACSSSSSSSPSAGSSTGSTSSSQPALVMESSPENSITKDFNPFSTTTPVYGMGADGLIYEPLIQFDVAAPPKYYPYLATSFTWGPGGKSITFAVRTGVKWSDGQAFTPADVVFTYKLLAANPKINLNGLPITGATASGNNVTVTFSASQYTNLQNIAGVAMLPQHIWATAGDPSTFADATPVGTGPYVLSNFTPEGFTLAANPSYWQAVPVKKVYFPAYASNTGAQNALFSGQIDWTGNFIPGLQKSFVDPSPSTHGYWDGPERQQRAVPEPQHLAHQPAPGPEGHQRGHRPHPDRRAGRGRPGEPGDERDRPYPADVLRLEAPARSRRTASARPPTRPARGRSSPRPATRRTAPASMPSTAGKSR